MEEEPLPDDLPDDMEEDNEDEKEKPLALIVDDNEDLVDFMKDSLSLYFRIQSASNGREAWQKIQMCIRDRGNTCRLQNRGTGLYRLA